MLGLFQSSSLDMIHTQTKRHTTMEIGMLWFSPHGYMFAILFCWFVILTVARRTDPSEVKGLLAIKKSLNDPMGHLDNWNKGDPCMSNWTGVFCSGTISADGYSNVEKLHLLNMNLSGSLAAEIGQLSHLQILDFMWNKLTGSIPKKLGNIKSLTLLLLNGNKLSGSLPEELGNLSNLDRLQVDQNDISGPIPKSFSNLKKIRHLHLNNNSISGQIPSELSNIPNLYHLLLDNNNLSGYLPSEFFKLSELRILQLDNNNFKGSQIPGSYGNMSRIVKLSLRNCSLEGPVPDLSRISNFSYLDLSFNKLTGSIPSSKLSDKMTTIDMSYNHLNGSLPESFSYLPTLQTLSLVNNKLTGSVPSNIWRRMSFGSTARLILDLRNNSFESIMGDLDLPQNVTLRLQGNPICDNGNIRNIGKFCRSQGSGDESPDTSTNATDTCPIQACPVLNFYDYVPGSPVSCYCASPLRIGYRLKSPSFSFFPPYENPFKVYLTASLKINVYQLSVESFQWEEGPRLRMHLKLFPAYSVDHSTMFNASEIQRIKAQFTSWEFSPNDTFGPYELLNFTLLGPYVNSSDFETQIEGTSKGILAAILGGAIVSAVFITAIVAALLKARYRNKYRNLSKRRISSLICMKIDGVKSFTFREMALATDNFNSSTQVGQGGFGKVYKGCLTDNTLVAIKRADDESFQGQKEFLTEIELLSRLHHRNLVSLIGYCDEQEEQMLVYEFMPNGTIRNWVSGKVETNLNFAMRVRIALGSAKGILYLHTEAQPPIFHRDIKATNILLDSRFTAKVADFGLSRLAPLLEDEGCVPDHVSTVVKGTPGYLDPEYFLTRKLTDKSDVYSLGVVFLELLTGMQPISHGKNIVCEVSLAHQSGTMFGIIDSKMGSYPSECVERFGSLALTCCHEKTESRPSMLDVVRELENILRLMPETDINSSGSGDGSGDGYSGASASPSLSYFSKNNMYMSSDMLGSDLVSGTFPRITPR